MSFIQSVLLATFQCITNSRTKLKIFVIMVDLHTPGNHMLNFIALNKSVHVQHSFAVLYHEPWSLKEFRSYMVISAFTFIKSAPKLCKARVYLEG